MADQRFRISNLSQIIIYKLYLDHIDGDEHRPLTLRQIAALFDQKLPLNLIDSSIEWMRLRISRDFLRRIGTKESYRYAIAPEGIKYVEMELLRKNSPIAHFQDHGDGSLPYVAGLNSPFMTEDERRSLDDDWVPLDIDRTTPAYIEAEQAIAEAVTAIEQDNQFAANMPDERAGILQTLRSGIDWIKTKSPTKRQLKHLIVSPLNWIMANFSKTVMAEVAKKAAEKLLAFLNTFT